MNKKNLVIKQCFRPSNLFTQAPVEVVADGPPHPCDESDRQAQRQKDPPSPLWKRILLPLDGSEIPFPTTGWMVLKIMG